MRESIIALNRFGLGARPRDDAPPDAPAWLKAQMRQYAPALPTADRLAARAEVVGRYADYIAAQKAAREQRRATQMAAAMPPPAAEPAAMQTPPQIPAQSPAQPPAAPASPTVPAGNMGKELLQFSRDQYVAQVGARLRAALASDTPFIEALVHFWSNHFAVSADRQAVIALAGLMEFEAIRPNVLGRFEDMLVAVEQHPAMLLYLDQAQSIGPNSPLGLRGRRRIGLNENLGREILELHTLGVRTGYDQGDVTEFARALTGWTVAGFGRGPAARPAGGPETGPGSFLFADALHEPGTRRIMGRDYAQPGEGQARAVLADLARHPATARHIAIQIARHFVADDPPPALVSRLERAFLASGGDLPAVYAALIDAPESWSGPPAKFRTPWEWCIACFRALGGTGEHVPDRAIAGMMTQLGQPVWRPGSPAGYDDVAAGWAGPDALLRRVEMAQRLAGQAPGGIDPRALAGRLFPDSLSMPTREAIARADSPQQGLALLLVSPEMLRR